MMNQGNNNQTKKLAAVSALAGVVLSALSSTAAAATPANTTTVDTGELSNRQDKKIGFYLGVINEPAPSLLSINAGYNLTDFVRLTAGVGRLSASMSFGDQTTEASVTTVGAGAKFMVPGWNLTPTAGVHFASVFYSGQAGMIEVAGLKDNASHVYFSAGLDYQSEGGFNMGVGVNQSLNSQLGTSTYLNVGWFFDFV